LSFWSYCSHLRTPGWSLHHSIRPTNRKKIRFFIEDTQARAVVTEGANVTVKEAVAGLALPIWHPRVDSRGVVQTPELPPASRANFDAPNPDDVALFAYTSGTTDRA
jgi:non-ribosomal peptide synthetase component F